MLIYVLPFISTILLFSASPGPGYAALSWISLIPLYVFLHRASPKQSFWTGWLAGVVYYLLLIYWVTISMETYGGLAPWLSISALVLLCLYMGLYHGLFCWLMSRAMTTGTAFPIWFGACVWVGLDYIRGFMFSGFPWMDVGYFHYESLLRQVADLGGHHLLTFLVILANGLLYRFLQDRSVKLSLKQNWLAILCLALAFTYSPLRLAQIKTVSKEAPALQTGVIQANINQGQKWQPEQKLASVNKHIGLTNTALASSPPPELILWPETSLPFYPSRDPLFHHVQAETVESDGSYELLCGAPHIIRKEEGYDLYNAALLLGPDKSPTYYFKQHLVPFGEYVPLRNVLPLPKALVQSIGDFTRGKDATLLHAERAAIGALICVEAIYPDLARKEVNLGADLLANITNDAWFGRSSAPIQHLAMTVFRAVENRRSIARAANTGISALILPTGEIIASSELFTEAILVHPLPLLKERTIFSRFGFLFPVFCLMGAIILSIRKKQSHPQRH
ncbi:MAG: apolipoprotein N-acyltransferase [Desulfobulbaceae bacterium]|jgi:apolipoprotein N-acyltransferase|nr:apolipoprotein N-acyltransferase [Desulfobulbaceae bacterium]